MIERKNKSIILSASATVGTAGAPGYLHSVAISSNGAAAGTISLYDGSDTSGTLKWTMMVSATAGTCTVASGLNIWFQSGMYALIANIGLTTIEYSGCA